jgi:hypothetical protein
MKDGDGQERCFGIAYWKRRWVFVPFFHVPDSAVTEDGELVRFKCTPLDRQIIEPLQQRETKAREKNQALVKETIVPWLLAEKELKQLCRRNDLPLAWVTDRFLRNKRNVKKGANRREDRKIRSINSKEFRRIHKELTLLNEPTSLIIAILWYLNNSLGKGGAFVTLEEIVRLQVEDVSPEQANASNWVRLLRTGISGTHLIVHCLPSNLWKRLCRQINDNLAFVFSNRDGGPLLPVQVDTQLKKAAKLAGFKESITSASFRPQFDKEQVKRSEKRCRLDASVKPYLDPVNLEEWSAICEHIPAILGRKGRKSSHDPRDLLNAMLHLKRTSCPIRKLPEEFPPWRAVESQQRRWKKSKVLGEIIALRKSKSEI